MPVQMSYPSFDISFNHLHEILFYSTVAFIDFYVVIVINDENFRALLDF